MSSTFELTIGPRRGWQPLDFREIWHYRELLGFLVWRDIKIRYKQTFFGALWAILQPLLAMLVFTVLFNRLAGINTDGPPYPLFAYAGLVAWTFFSGAVTASSNSLIGNQDLISKIYFPRVFLPLAAIGALAVDMVLNLALMGVLMVYYRWPASSDLLGLPFFMLGTLLAGSGLGLVLSALNVYFRDIKYAVPFFMQMGLFVTPIIYPVRYIPAHFRLLIGLNPMSGMAVGFRHCLLASPAAWDLIGISSSVTVAVFVAGLFIFRRMERRFADII